MLSAFGFSFVLIFPFSLPLVMSLNVGKKYKTKANRTKSSSFTQVDRVRFPIARSSEIFETLTKFRSI